MAAGMGDQGGDQERIPVNAPAKRQQLQRRYSWQDYEQAKADWVWRHPEATYQEIEKAIREIAQKMGI